MRCPHCLVSIHDNWTSWSYPMDDGWSRLHLDEKQFCFGFKTTLCPACERIIAVIERYNVGGKDSPLSVMVYPKASTRPVPREVENTLAEDFREACLVIGDSEKASAALSRRCLQKLLIEKAGVKEKANLSSQIQMVIDSGMLPSHLVEGLDAVRTIGNFAAHPIKSTQTGDILEVEQGEAEWLLEILEQLFDFYFVQPATLERKRAALNKKLKEAGKPELKL